MFNEESLPAILGEFTQADNIASILYNGSIYELEPYDSSAQDIATIVKACNGQQKISDIENLFAEDKQHIVQSILQQLDDALLVDDNRLQTHRSGASVILELQELSASLISKTINKNPFWENVLNNSKECPASVFYGLAIENFHFLFREALFDSPILGYVPNAKVRQIMNEFYIEEFGHDDLVLQALESINISRETMQVSLPLPETLAMCNALSYYASNDPLFFFSTLGILEGGDIETDVFIEACNNKGLSEGFIGPMKTHSDININDEHGNLTRLIFAEIPAIDEQTVQRLRRQTYLFIEMYDNFYTAIWNHYSQNQQDFVRVIAGYQE